MNLLARILSHGFAIAIVLLLAIGLIYRGELFPDWELPEFLSPGTPTEREATGAEESIAPGTPAAESVMEAAGLPETSREPTPAVANEEAAAVATEAPGDVPVEEPSAPEAAAMEAVEPAALTETPGGIPVTVPAAKDATEDSAETSTGQPVIVPEPGVPVDEATTDITAPTTTEPATAPTATQPADEIGDEPAAVPEEETAQPAPESAIAPEIAVPVAADLTEPAVAATTEEPVPEMSSSAPDTEASAADTGIADTATTLATVDTAPTETTGLEAAQASPAAALEPPAIPEQPASQVTEAVLPADASPQPGLAAAAESQGVVPPGAEPAEINAYQVLAEAREAYWLRDYESAENKYRQLTVMEPDNPDSYGELGNMYFSQGKWEQAASAYFDAGIRLVKEGQLEQAQQLVDVIRGLDGTQADELNKQIVAAQAATH